MPRSRDAARAGTDGSRQAPRALVATGIVLVALLTLVAVATHRGGGSGTARRGSGVSNSFLSYAVSTYLVVAVAMTALVLVFLVRNRDSLEAPPPRRNLRSLVFFLLAVVCVALLTSLRLFHPHVTGRNRLKQPPQASTIDAKKHGHGASTPRLVFKWAPLGVLVVLLAGGAVVYVLGRRRLSGFRARPSVAEEIGGVLDLALDDLRAERDPRRAIIAAYARMERLLGAHGIPRRAAEAPFEYLARVLTELEASPTPVFELTTLFERAKFSHHSIEPQLKDEAIDALVAVREELRAA
ncbi:MAG TPA: DUF4129 domain-containing protein [Gaiellaceae bacterium]